jgi:6-phosphogluconate dehydrogenase
LGIEYAIMQAIAECHGLMSRVGGLGPEAIGGMLERWNASTRASGFLLEITAEIAKTRDPLTNGYLHENVSDAAGQKGTGAWSVEAGLAHGVPVPSIMEAVSARQISGQAGARKTIQKAIADSPSPDRTDSFFADLESALVATMIVSLCQGLHLYAAAADQHGWRKNLSDVLRVWRAGSILRMGLLDDIAAAWRRTVAASVLAGFPAPVLATSLAYVEALGTKALPTAVVQAQRDRFGAHGFARTDRGGVHHGPWVHPDQEDSE